MDWDGHIGDMVVIQAVEDPDKYGNDHKDQEDK
jgi:hypothetical protein